MTRMGRNCAALFIFILDYSRICQDPIEDSYLFGSCVYDVALGQKKSSLQLRNKIDIRMNIRQVVGNIKLLDMNTKIKYYNNEHNAIQMPTNIVRREPSSYKYRILPYLKTINHECLPIDYKFYQRNRKTKRMQIIKPENNSDLCLTGEGAYSAPREKQFNNNQGNLMHLLTVRQKQTVINHKTLKIYPERVSHTKSQRHKVDETQINECNKTNFKTDKAFLPKKIISNYNETDSPAKSQGLKKVNASSNAKSNWSMQTKSAIDLQRPLVFLDKKQLSQIKAEYFVMMQYPSLQVITGNRFRNTAQIASLTKIMTFYTVYKIALQKQIEISQQFITIDEEAGEMTGTSAQLIAGDLINIQQLLYGLMLPSGNDAALALAKWGGALVNSNPDEITPLASFICRMNKYAKILEMKQSSFGNPHGLPNFKNISNPYDIALLVAHCLQIPLFCKIISTTSFNIWINNDSSKRQVIWQNTNKLLRRKGFIGVKTGVTVTAGPCLATCYERGNQKFIVVLLRTNKLSRRFKQTRMVLGWTLLKYNSDLYRTCSKEILKHDAVLDSDNSEDEQEFHYEKVDADELAKRNKILVYEL